MTDAYSSLWGLVFGHFVNDNVSHLSLMKFGALLCARSRNGTSTQSAFLHKHEEPNNSLMLPLVCPRQNARPLVHFQRE